MGQDPATFGARLRAFRSAAGLSQEELAERSGLSLRTIGNLERGSTRWPYRNSVQRLADGLDLQDRAREAFVAAAGRQLARNLLEPASPGSQTAGEPAGPGGSGSPHTQHTQEGSPGRRRESGPMLTPRQLPAAVPGFAGRGPELASLSRVLGRAGGTAVIAAVGGTAGVGKTALAVHWAHQVAADFPDGQLYLNLRGFDPLGSPVEPADALRDLLEGLAVSGAQLPATIEAQLGLYRSLLTGKRILILLDNALDEAQVRPLLPGSLTCRVVVTSRNQLTGLVATDAAHPVTLDVLSGSEAHELLRQRLGDDRVAADPQAAARIIQASAGLPLALSIVAARAALRPQARLTRLADDISAAPGLTAFSSPGDVAADVRIVLSWSYRQLDTGTARAFRLASLHPGLDLDAFAVAALTGTTPEQAGQALGLLARTSLVQGTEPGRYRMHDLLRRYARELAGHDSAAESTGALTRLFDYYVHTAAMAVNALYPAEQHLRPAIAPSGTRGPVITGQAQARTWLETELGALIDTVAHATENGWPAYAIQMSGILARHLETEGLHARARVIHQYAAQAARQAGDPTAEADALIWAGIANGQQDRRQESMLSYSQALAVARTAGYRHGQARALNFLGLTAMHMGRHLEAASTLEQALDLHTAAGNRTGMAYALSNLGVISERQGRNERAVSYQRRALDLFRDLADQHGAATVLSRLGRIHLQQDEDRQAADVLRQALALYHDFSDKQGEARVRSSLGFLQLRRQGYEQAAAEFQQALAVFREVGDLGGQAETLNGLGSTCFATGGFTQARVHHAEALELASQASNQLEQARAHYGAGCACQALGRAADARRHWRQSLSIYTALESPEADRVRAMIAAAQL